MLPADLHIHTLLSGHAFCTFNECVDDAHEKGLSLIAITDHGPSMFGGPQENYFKMFNRCPKSKGSMLILFGCETNIIDVDGELDLPSVVLSRLDIVLAGLHGPTPYRGTTEAHNTKALISLMKNNQYVNIITHPVRHGYPISVKDVVYASLETNVLLELNVNLILQCLKKIDKPNNKKVIEETSKMIDLLQNNKRKYVVNSDAHHVCEIGISDSYIDMLKSIIGVKEEFIINKDKVALSHHIPSIKTISQRTGIDF
jgi:putative hydrolase